MNENILAGIEPNPIKYNVDEVSEFEKRQNENNEDFEKKMKEGDEIVCTNTGCEDYKKSLQQTAQKLNDTNKLLCDNIKLLNSDIEKLNMRFMMFSVRILS
jgi:predicted nuclease with TOPRIM domain